MNTGLTALHLVKAFVTLLPCFKMFAATKTAAFCRTRKPPGGQKVPFPERGSTPKKARKNGPAVWAGPLCALLHDTNITH